LESPLLVLSSDDIEDIVGKPIGEWDNWNTLKLFAESVLPNFSGRVYIQVTAWYSYPKHNKPKQGKKRRGGRPPHQYRLKGSVGRETIIAFEMSGGQLTQISYKKKIRPKFSPRRSGVYSLTKTILANQKKKEKFPEL